MSRRAQQQSLEEREKIQKEREQRKADREKEQRALQQAFNSQGQLSRGWMRELLDTDDLEERLQPNTIRKIQAMLNKQWILSNLTDAETHDRQYWLEVMRYKLLGDHPPRDSVITGPTRAFLLDDEWENLQPLTAQERNEIDQIIKGIQNMVTRSRGGFERKQINTDIARTETDSDDSDDGGKRWGLF